MTFCPGLAIYPRDEYNKLDEISYPEIITVEKDSEIKKEATYTGLLTYQKENMI